jgi:hypothetical protein
VSDSLDLPKDMAETLGDPGSGACHELANAWKRYDAGVVVDAELSGLTGTGGGDMNPLDPFAALDLRCQPSYARVISVGDTRQQDRNVQAKFFGHPHVLLYLKCF